MTKAVIRIGVIGAFGRLGSLVCETIETLPQCAIAAVLKSRNPVTSSYTLMNTVSDVFKASDVVIDVSKPELFNDVLVAACETKKPFVSGTTGLSEKQHDEMQALSKDIPIFYTTNFSLGIALINQAVGDLAAKLDLSFDAEIVEYHHRHKVDAPSGTALTLGKTIAKARGQDFSNVACFDRTHRHTERPTGEIGFSISRGGGVFGEHIVHFISDEEKIDIGHVAFNRATFAKGAVKAALWLLDQHPGIYSMADFIKSIR